MKILIVLFLFLFSPLVFAKEANPSHGNDEKSIQFFVKEFSTQENKWQFNEYENFFSGVAAFVIGNIGYATTDSSALALTYSAIQTIGIINIGEGLYKINSPSIEGSFKELLTNKKVKHYSKKDLAFHLIKIYAKEKRAKRLSFFYSASILSAQYILNATVYNSPTKLKNVYIFLGSINAIMATYMAFNKSSYESFLFGDHIDLNPFAFKLKNEGFYGARLSFSF